ncbi:MAG: serpin family protein [Cyanomargarita calcarea GSE-NOS-MK-12-04C]|jgi:serpin B|uniref:Serpin family protein n=1 Tax=Cyanomargarita calcarea GSE-NOS-MK-12-04C TaxID=2839659 RepID=A0A951QWU2_9CYAN|nr:serpin family protein [Cyanomargarita calcarea GSE-NOS-MK-12-04C]
MKQKFSNAREIFLQRRYGVRLGRRYVLAAAGVMLLGVIGCSQVTTDTSALAQSQLPRSESTVPKAALKSFDNKLVAANTRFGFKLFSELLKEDSSKNVFVSPSSVAIALAIAYNGAGGSTRQAMAKVLDLQGLSLEQINTSNGALKAMSENPDEKVQLTIANSLWANKDASFNPEFLQTSQDFYKAKVTSLNFGDAGTPSIINNWINENTRGKITKIVDQIPPDQMLFLINAIYFKGSWTKEFDKKQTAQYPFNLTSGTQTQQLMMSQTGEYRYLENDQFQAVSLPYGQNGQLSFYVFLPLENSSLKTFSQKLDAVKWEKWMAQFRKQEGFIRLPSFQMEYDITLNSALKALGMGEAFSNKANFSGMGKNLAISEVKHKTFVEVNEEGTEAAASTSVGMVTTSVQEKPQPFTMIVDRPFFCAIRDNQTGSILFMGSIVKPQ